tara:strand:+ start:589 stop:1992 length:1404 start_codon:yes stop_codon:yes gene_type:complete
MALRLRRGTNAERQLITPAQGELIYTTDTKALYIGDGSTAGGIVVQGGGGGGASTLNDLTDVVIGSLADGQILSYNSGTTKWGPTNLASITFGKLNQHTDVLYPDNVPNNGDILMSDGANWLPQNFTGGQWNIDIVGSDSSLLVDGHNNKITGNLNGDIIDPGDNSTILDSSTRIMSNVTTKHANNTTAYDPSLRAFFGDFVGNHQGDVYSSTITGTVKLLDHSTGIFYGDVSGGDIWNSDSSLLLSAHTGTLYGDVVGSIYADDSTTIVDGITGKIVGSIKTTNVSEFDGAINIAKNVAADPVLAYYSTTHGAFPTAPISVQNIGNSAISNEIGLSKFRGTNSARLAVQSGDSLGGIAWAGADVAGGNSVVAGAIRATVTAAPSANSIEADITILTRDGAIGNYGEALRVRHDKVTTFSGAAKLVNYADTTARDAAITTPETGMMIYLTATHKAQVYANSAWVDLH